MISVRNERGEEVTRQVVGVGALQPGEERTFTFAVEVFAPPEPGGDASARRPVDAASTSPIRPRT